MRQVTVPQMAAMVKRQFQHNPARPLFFWGPPGVGKTMTIKQVAADLGVGFKETRIATMVPSDLRGVPVPDMQRKVTEWFTGEFLPDPKVDGPAGILLLDEYPQAPPVMQGLAQRIVLERRMGERYKLPDGWMVVALGNRREDRASVYEMPAQTQNRFKHFLVMPDVDSFTEYAVRNDFHPHIIAFLNTNAEFLFQFEANASSKPAWPSPRSWEAANEDYSLTEDPNDLEQSVGARAKDQFLAFYEVALMLPDQNLILEGLADDLTLPAARNSKYALVVALGSRMRTAEQGINAFKWLKAKGLDNELIQVFLEMIVRRATAKGDKGLLAQLIAADPELKASIEELMRALLAV